MIINPVTKEDFLQYLDAGIRVIPLEKDKPLVPMWDSLPWDELPSNEIIVNSWFDLYKDRITGMAVTLGEEHNGGLCCLRINTTDLEIVEKMHLEFQSKVICHAGKIQYLFFKNIHHTVLSKYEFKCPSKGGITALYRSQYVPLPPSYHSEHTLFQWSDSGFSTLLNTMISDLDPISHSRMLNIGSLINSPTTESANINLANEDQFSGRLHRKQAIDGYLDKIYERNPHSPIEDTVSQILNYDALNYIHNSFFLGDTWSTINREANALSYVAGYNAEYVKKTGIGATFDTQIDSETVVFNKLVPIDEAHTKFNQNKTPIFNNDLIPEVWRGLIEEVSDGQGTPPQALFMSMLTSIGACMQGNVVIKPLKEEFFYRRTNLAVALVASSGSKKSDVIRIATKEVAKINSSKAKSNSQQDLVRIQDIESRIEMITKEKKKPGVDMDALNDELFRLQDELNKNPLKGTKFVYGNATVQKMILDAKRNQDTGLFMIKDEMKQLFADMKKKGNEDYRTFYMEGFDGNGDGFTYSTIGRSDDFIERHFLSLLTGVQPDVLSVYIKQLYSAYGDNDGFLQRIILVPFGERVIKKPRPVDFKKFTKAYEIFNTGHYHPEIEVGVSEEAIDTYILMREEINLRAARYGNNGPLASILFKHEGFLSVIAFLYEMLMTEKMPTEIGYESLKMAMRLLEYIGECAKYLFDVKDKQEDSEAMVSVAKLLSQRHFRNEATQSEWYQNVRHLFKFPGQFYNALKELELRGYVSMRVNKSNSITMYINPLVNRL